MARINKSRYAILGMLAIKSMSGYEIKSTMQKSTNYFWAESDGQLYPILRTLNKEKLIKSKQEFHGARQRKIHSITTKGKKALTEWLITPPEPPTHRIEFALKIFFGAHAPKEISIKHIEDYKHDLIEHEKICKLGIAHIKAEHKYDPNKPYILMTIRRGLLVIQAALKWSDEALAMLKKIKEH